MGGLFRLVVASCLTIELLASQNTEPAYKLDPNAWWGPECTKYHNDTSIRPFEIVFHDKMIADLRYRLNNHRKPVPPLEGIGFEYGFNSNILDGWLQYWAEEYPFKEREIFLNKYPQYVTNIQGLDIHFIKYRQKAYAHQEIVPLLILHGWPGSVREFYETIPHLTSVNKSRDFAVEVIAPTLPGFGYSDAAVRPGLGMHEIAVVFSNLMKRLGYKKYYVQGGDWGAFIGSSIATIFPNEVLGYHTNFGLSLTQKALSLTLFGSLFPSPVVDPALVDRVDPLSGHIRDAIITEFGYMYIQATKPDTLGIAMTDSPGGLLAYFLQLISTGTRSYFLNLEDGGIDKYYTRDQLLDNIMMYWAPNSITTSFRIYAESLNRRTLALGISEIPTPVPTITIHAKDEIAYQSPLLLRTKFTNLLYTTNIDTGGHFLALEMPILFANDVLNAIAEFRNWHAKGGHGNGELLLNNNG